MIKVVYHRKYHRVTMSGHAHSGEAGHDLVCAAASILAYTLAANMHNLVKHDQAMELVTNLNPGDTELSCVPKSKYRHVVTAILDSICVGFELLERNTPEYISYEIRG